MLLLLLNIHKNIFVIYLLFVIIIIMIKENDRSKDAP